MKQLFFKQFAIIIYKKEDKHLLVCNSIQQNQLIVPRMNKTLDTSVIFFSDPVYNFFALDIKQKPLSSSNLQLINLLIGNQIHRIMDIKINTQV